MTQANNVAIESSQINSSGVLTVPGGGTGLSTVGTSGYFLQSNGTGLQYTAVAGVTPGGSNTQVQFNNSGSFGASSNLTYNGTLLNVTNNSGGYGISVTGSYNGYMGMSIYNSNASSSAVSYLQFGNNTSQFLSYIGITNSSWTSLGGGNAFVINQGLAYPIVFGISSSEVMRIDSSGNLLLGTTTTPSGISNSLTFLDGTYQKSANITIGQIFEYNATTTLPATVWGKLVTSNTASATTLTLPSLSGNAGKVISISNINTGPVTIVTGSSNGAIFGMGLNGGTTIYLPAYSSIELATDGGNWKALTSNTIVPTSGTAPYLGARAWAKWGGGNQTTAGSIFASYNCSSITVNSTGRYTFNFSISMPSANYAISALTSYSNGNTGIGISANQDSDNPPTAGRFDVAVWTSGYATSNYVYAIVFA